MYIYIYIYNNGLGPNNPFSAGTLDDRIPAQESKNIYIMIIDI